MRNEGMRVRPGGRLIGEFSARTDWRQGLIAPGLGRLRRKHDFPCVEERRGMAAVLQRQRVPGNRPSASGQEQGGEKLPRVTEHESGGLLGHAQPALRFCSTPLRRPGRRLAPNHGGKVEIVIGLIGKSFAQGIVPFSKDEVVLDHAAERTSPRRDPHAVLLQRSLTEAA
jgi:hypothetical protein